MFGSVLVERGLYARLRIERGGDIGETVHLQQKLSVVPHARCCELSSRFELRNGNLRVATKVRRVVNSR